MTAADCLFDIQLGEIPGAHIPVKDEASENNAPHHNPCQQFLRTIAGLVSVTSKDPMSEVRFKHAAIDLSIGPQGDAAMKESLLIKKVVAFALAIKAGLWAGLTCLASAYLSVLSGLAALVEPLLKTYAFVNQDYAYSRSSFSP